MTVTSYPFNNQDTSETQYSELFRNLQDSGVVGDISKNFLQVSGDGTGMNVKVAAGYAIVRGHAFKSTATETVPVAASDAGGIRKDYVVLRLDPGADSIVLAVVKGAVGGAAPTLTQTDTGIYELPLAIVTVRASAPTVLSTDVADDRRWTGTRVGLWTTATRPFGPRIGQLGLNATTAAWEFWNGAQWAGLTPTISWNNLTDKPLVFPTDWASVANKPNTYNPSAHAHEGMQKMSILGGGQDNGFVHNGSGGGHLISFRWDGRVLFRVDQTEFELAREGHGHQDLTAFINQVNQNADRRAIFDSNPFTVARAQGSDRPHAATPAGSGWLSVWVDGNHNFCRNTSSIRYKKNVRDLEWTNGKGALALRPVTYDRKDTTDPDTGEVTPGRKGEHGLIAEEVNEVLPEIVSWHEGQIDSVRYDLLGLALIPVVKDQQARIEKLEKQVQGLTAAYQARKK